MSPGDLEEEELLSSPIPNTPTYPTKQNSSQSSLTPKNLKFIDLKSPKVRALLMKSLRKISSTQKNEVDQLEEQSHITKIKRTFPRTFRVHYSILTPEEGV